MRVARSPMSVVAAAYRPSSSSSSTSSLMPRVVDNQLEAFRTDPMMTQLAQGTPIRYAGCLHAKESERRQTFVQNCAHRKLFIVSLGFCTHHVELRRIDHDCARLSPSRSPHVAMTVARLVIAVVEIAPRHDNAPISTDRRALVLVNASRVLSRLIAHATLVITTRHRWC